ncbi:MAG: polyamine aminopropyltransferase [bacterium]
MELWFTEKHTKNLGITLKIKTALFHGKSEYQVIDVLDTFEFGRMLLLDGLVMITERDEFVYHEMITHTPICVHPNPSNILVIGGGDGGTIREILRHSEVKKADLVEIDKMVIEKSMEFFPNVTSKLKDPKVNIIVKDGIEYIKKHKNEYDIVIIDSTDPIGPGEGLFRREFYRSVFDSLKEDGIMVAQTESPFINGNLVADIFKNIKSVFPIVKMYTASIPTYPSGYWSFSFGSKKYDPIEDFNQKRAADIQAQLKYYNSEIHKASFALPNFAQKLCS